MTTRQTGGHDLPIRESTLAIWGTKMLLLRTWHQRQA